MSGPVRSGAYSGGSRLAVPFPGTQPEPPPAPPQTSAQPASPPADPDEDDAGGEDQEERPAPSPRRSLPSLGGKPNTGDASGFLLGLLVWGWVVLPYLKGGTPRVKAVLMAKFLNRAADGSDLP